jgi:rare lipoprotein A
MDLGSFYLSTLLFINVLTTPNAHLLGIEQKGKASFYANMFDGRTTSCGEKFSQKEFTAAHRSFPFHTMLEVVNLANNKSIIVRINDRGPYNRNRVLDLTKAGAEKLGFLKTGVANIKLRVVGMEGMILLGKDELITEMGDIIEKAVSN